jgi:hypothetical protein
MALRGLLLLAGTVACLFVAGCGGAGTKTVTTTRTDTATVTAPPAHTAPSGAPGASVRAQDAKAKDDARKAVSELDLCGRDAGTYQGCKGSGIPRNVELADLTGDGYMVTAESESGATFTVTKSSSATTRSCSPPGVGGCPASGSW